MEPYAPVELAALTEIPRPGSLRRMRNIVDIHALNPQGMTISEIARTPPRP